MRAELIADSMTNDLGDLLDRWDAVLRFEEGSSPNRMPFVAGIRWVNRGLTIPLSLESASQANWHRESAPKMWCLI